MTSSREAPSCRETEIHTLHAALLESETRYRLVMEATSDGIWDWDVRTDRVHYSPAYTRMLGFEPEEFCGNLAEWLDRIHPEDREKALRENRRCIDNEVSRFSVEFRMRTKSGEWKWILGRGMAVTRDASGKALRMIGTHTDITPIKEGEHREASQKWIAALLSTMTRLDERLQLILAGILETVHTECGGIYLLEEDKRGLRLVQHHGLSEAFAQAVRTYDAHSPNLRLVMAGNPLYTSYDALPVDKTEEDKREGLKARAVIPIHHEGRVVGCLNVASRSLPAVPEGVRTFLETVGVLLGNAFGGIQARQALEESTRQYAVLFDPAGDAFSSFA
ncbi:MAG: PAS domain-containing protein [Desulfosoma sp.]|uniref:PAS domain-containing protein n=1 Tax=Desulfosoma sp. TaxID=2603217 RepID=UPI00404A92B9